eukprot:CAMPEP_0203921008 /NCGR_PEP_ID=MMETSP0359-20131031/61229_1 /ASSEMBLY_ACC=CAM_ASM_000338 /TAXON_ID=268821 /ORGANISM="Scrippsiella Hangoei, Strain SHTV-5" /LENGTH=97 /DNA_ID=CAMNT_0050848619 /DNA_START=252 /DNA_END=545 /DNA_ORIENTATION=+
MPPACKQRLRRMASGDCATPTARFNASQDEAAMVSTCKRRLRRRASSDCATTTERCNPSRDEVKMLNTCMQAATAPSGNRRLCRLKIVMLVRLKPQW